MGLRDDAEKLIAEQDARAAAAPEDPKLILARKRMPQEMAAWTTGMGLEMVPEYTVIEADYRGRDDDDHPSAFVRIEFEVDGIRFFAALKLYMGSVSFGVNMGGTSYGISTMKDVAAGLRYMKDNPMKAKKSKKAKP